MLTIHKVIVKELEARIERYKEALEKIAKVECGWCSARYKATTALENKDT